MAICVCALRKMEDTAIYALCMYVAWIAEVGGCAATVRTIQNEIVYLSEMIYNRHH